MASIKFGAFLTDMRGKIGGSVFSKNKNGAYAKNKVTPSNPQSGAQMAVRNLLAGFAQQWRTLTETVRQGWIDGAVNFPRTNVFGDSYTLSGNMLFNSLNSNLAKIGISPITACPSPKGVSARVIDNVTATATTLDVEIGTAIATSDKAIVRATVGLSAGVNNFKSKLRDIAIVDTSSTSTLDVIADYTAKFGAPVASTAIGVALVVVNKTTGEEGAPSFFRVIVS